MSLGRLFRIRGYMKVYLLFKLKDPKSKKKEFVVDKVFTSKTGAFTRELRLHKNDPIIMQKGTILKSEHQETFVINKSLKGIIANGN